MKRPGYFLTAAARLDMLGLWNYLAEHASLAVADKVAADVESGIRKLAGNPALGHRRVDLTDRDLLFYRVHSYLIIYRQDKRPVRVVRILHAARDVENLLNA